MLCRPIEAISPIPIASFCTNGTRCAAGVAAPPTGLGLAEDMNDVLLAGERQGIAITPLPITNAAGQFSDAIPLTRLATQVSQFSWVLPDVIKFRRVVAE